MNKNAKLGLAIFLGAGALVALFIPLSGWERFPIAAASALFAALLIVSYRRDQRRSK